MFKNLLKKNMIVIFGIALLCSALVAYSFIRSSSNTSSFEQSGYVHVDVNESEDKRVLFSGGQKYKNIVDSKIKFNDSASKERRIGSDNFIHYDDDSIAAFKDGVIVNIGELSSETSTMNHFYISPGMALRNTGSSYTAENSGQEIDFSDFLWKISENKYLAISKSISANFSETDQRDCGTYAEITYLDGKVIQIQTDDNVWQTISDEAKLILNDGSIVDLAMKNIKDQNGNVLLDFSRIIIDPNSNIELTPFDAEMESINENVIPRFVVNNTPGDSGADGTSGIIGLTGVDGLDGNKGKQGEDGLSDDKRGDDEGKQFPVFSVMNWKVTPNSCTGKIFVEDESEVLITSDASGSGLVSSVYLVDLDTGENIPLPESARPSAYQFAEIRNSADSGFEFTFSGLKTDHSYMLYASAPIQMSEETNVYSRGFVAKTFWTDSSGVYIEAAAIDTNSYQIVAHTNNINSNIGVYTFKYPFEDYDLLSTLDLSTIVSKYSNYIIENPIWTVNTDPTADVIPGSYTFAPFTTYITIDGSGNPVVDEDIPIKSNTHYYTMLLFSADGDRTVDDYSTQILDTLTLKKRPTVAPPSLESNKTIGGFDITPGIVTDEDAAVTNYAVEFYSIDHIDKTGGEASKYTVKIDTATGKPYEPERIVNLSKNSPTSASFAGLGTSDYVAREVLTVFDNEKEYFVYSTFSNTSHLEESIQPTVYFQPFGELDPEEATPLTTLSPYYDSCVGILHVYPGSNGYRYWAEGDGATIQIDGDNYSYNFLLKSVTEIDGDRSVYDGAKFPAITKSNGEVEIYFLDYSSGEKSWMSGLKPNSEYYVTVYGDLYTNPEDIEHSIEKHMTTVGKCTIKTPPAPGLHMAMSTSPSSNNILKDLCMAIATPSQLRSSMTKPITAPENSGYTNNEYESFYNRQLETFYGFKVTAYLNDYSEIKKYLPSTDETIVDGKTYYAQGIGNKYTEVDVTTDVNKNKKPCDYWYEYTEVPFKEEDYWFSKTFTKDTLWKSGTGANAWQVYMLYDFDSANDQLKTGVQVVGVPSEDGLSVTYVLSSNGSINPDSTLWNYPYVDYTKNADGTITPTDFGKGPGKTSSGTLNNITSETVKGGGTRYKIVPQYRIDSLFNSSISKGRASTATNTDYIVSSGGMVFSDDMFDDVLGTTLEQAVLGDEGVIKRKGALGVTFVIEEMFDYTGNPEEYSLNKQRTVKVATKDAYAEYDDDNVIRKVYYTKNGDLYTQVDFANINPSQLGLYEKDLINGTYVATTDIKEVAGHKYYYLYKGAYYELNKLDIRPLELGLYESANHYINYFENIGEQRIYIPFSRSIGDINLELPYNVDPNETQGKIERHPVSEDDKYHYYYTAQANFLNSNLLAETITYRVYDAVDFYNTQKHLNNDREYVNWALLGKDPRITNPTDVFTDTWLMQDVQTVDPNPTGEFVYQQIKGIDGTPNNGLEKIKPYTYGWYVEDGDKYVLTNDVSIQSGTTYYVNNGTNYVALDTSSFSPKGLKWYEEQIKEATENTVDRNKTYYAKTYVASLDGGSTTEYNVVDPDYVSPSSFCWYEKNVTTNEYFISNDTVVSPEASKVYYRYTGDASNPYVAVNKDYAVEGSVNPAGLGWFYGDKVLTEKTIVDSEDRFFVKYLINVHSTDELNSGAYSNYDSLLSPSANHYKEYAKKLAITDTEVVAGRRYYVQYMNEKNEPCYKLIDLTANEYKTIKDPSSADWYIDDTAAEKVTSYDKYFDTEKEYFTSAGDPVNDSISPATQGWYEKKKVLSNDTQIDYSKNYYAKKADGTYTEKINPNINPNQLNWYEKTKEEITSGSYNTSITYYAKRGDSYVLVGNPINPNAIGWYEAVKEVSKDTAPNASKKYFARVLDADWNESFIEVNTASLNPYILKWRIKDDTTKEKVIVPDSETSVVVGKTYYVPVGQHNYVEYKKVDGVAINPSTLGLFEEKRVLSSDTSANKMKTYYINATDTYAINISSLNLAKLHWYKDTTTTSKTLTGDKSFDKNKVYYPSEDATTPINASEVFNPNKFEWYEDEWVRSVDAGIDPDKEYAVRYLTKEKGASAVTTEGLELAKTTISFNNLPNNTPTIWFFPCTYEYAKLHYASVLDDATNCVFFDDDSFEELYGHQFVITYTINYHHYMSEEMNNAWHLIYPFDASAKLAVVADDGSSSDPYEATFANMAETHEHLTFRSVVSYFHDNPTQLPNGTGTLFGKNAYMAVPHNYLHEKDKGLGILDEPKEVPIAYALPWDSGDELTGTGASDHSKFVTTRVLVTDPYNSTFNYSANNAPTDNYAYTNVYVVPDKQASTAPKYLEEVKINNKPGNNISSETVAIKDIITAKSDNNFITDDNYAVGEVKVTDKAVSNTAPNGFIDANGLGYAPAVLPIQLYSNKYVSQKESLHILSTNKYVTGSNEVSTPVGPSSTVDNNWTFKTSTTNNDKYAPLFTASFNDKVDISTLTEQSTMKLKPHIENQELKGYDVELIAPPEVIKDAVGVRLRFEIHDYRELTPSDTVVSPTYAGAEAMGLYEAQMVKKATTDTTVTKEKSYFVQVGFRYFEYKESDTPGSSKFTPENYNWYIKVGEEYKLVNSIAAEDMPENPTYYYLKPETTSDYVAIDLNNINPKEMGWFDETYNDVKWTEDQNKSDDKKYLWQTEDVLYSMAIDKYLPMAESDTYSYSKAEGAKKLELKKDGDKVMVHMYFAIAADELDFDDQYDIGDSEARSFNGKDGIRVYANYIYESDKSGYSYLNNSGSGTLDYSKRVDSIINNKPAGSFSLRMQKLTSTNNNYYLEANPANRSYSAFVASIVAGMESKLALPENVYSVNITDEFKPTYENYKLNRFGSFFSIAESVDPLVSSQYLSLTTTRYQELGTEITQDLPFKAKVDPDLNVYIPSLLVADSNPSIKIISWKNGSFYEPATLPSFGIMQFPKSNLYIAFDDGKVDDGSIVTRQRAALNYQVYNAESTDKIYALVTTEPVDIHATHDSFDASAEYTSFMFNNSGTYGTSAKDYHVISKFNTDNTVFEPTIKLEHIMKTYVGQSTPSHYFDNIDADAGITGYSIKDLFIPVNGDGANNIDGLTLNALPYNSSYSVSFWIWSLISQTSEGSEYGWLPVPYSSLRIESATIEFRTGSAPNASLENCTVKYGIGDNHKDGYSNKSVTTNIHNGDNDLYYLVDIVDNETNKVISHLFTTDRTDINPRTFDLDGITGGDNAQTVYITNDTNHILGKSGASLTITSDTTDKPYTLFKYGKLDGGKERYKLVLHSYIMGTGPATLPDPNDYVFDDDADSAYKVYRYIKDSDGNTQKDTTAAHILNLNVAGREKQFSLNDSWDELKKDSTNIGIESHNSSNNKRADAENGPYLGFTINRPNYKSYSLVYEKYIPIIVKSHTEGGVQTGINITEKVFGDKVYGTANKEGGTPVPGLPGYYMFDYDDVNNIYMTADTKQDIETYTNDLQSAIENYDLQIGDTVTVFLLSVQDVMTGANNYLMQKDGQHPDDMVPNDVRQDVMEALIASKIKEYINNDNNFKQDGTLYATTQYDECSSGPFNTDVRMVSAKNIKILSKLIRIKPSHVFGTGNYRPEQLEKFAKVETLKSQLNALTTMKALDDKEMNDDKEALRAALAEYDNAKKDTARNEWIENQYDDFAVPYRNAAWEEEDIRAQFNTLVPSLETNYKVIKLNALQVKIDELRLKLGRLYPDKDDPVYYVEEHIPLSVPDKTDPTSTRKTTVLYDDTPNGKVIKQDSNLNTLPITPANTPGATKQEGSADKANVTDVQVQTIQSDLTTAEQARDADRKRTLKFQLKLDSESLREYGTANFDIWCYNGEDGNNGHIVQFNAQIKDVYINSEKTEGLYGCTIEINPAEYREDYDTVVVKVQYHEKVGSDTEVDVTDVLSRCSLTIDDIVFTPTGTETETINGKNYTYTKYSASGSPKTFKCTDVAVTGDKVYPTVQYTFKKQ